MFCGHSGRRLLDCPIDGEDAITTIRVEISRSIIDIEVQSTHMSPALAAVIDRQMGSLRFVFLAACALLFARCGDDAEKTAIRPIPRSAQTAAPTGTPTSTPASAPTPTAYERSSQLFSFRALVMTNLSGRKMLSDFSGRAVYRNV